MACATAPLRLHVAMFIPRWITLATFCRRLGFATIRVHAGQRRAPPPAPLCTSSPAAPPAHEPPPTPAAAAAGGMLCCLHHGELLQQQANRLRPRAVSR